jgi:hypothetical protein
MLGGQSPLLYYTQVITLGELLLHRPLRLLVEVRMALIDDYNQGIEDGSHDYFQRVQSALVITAINIQGEGAGVTDHSARSALALKVLADPYGYTKQMLFGFAAGGATKDGSSDQAILDRASAIWNAYAVQG